jgi:hypothetical protein
MRGIFMARSAVLALVATLCVSGALAAQSLTSIHGPGYPLMPVDARAAIMGGLGIGLHGFSVPMTNPAAASHARGRGAVVALEVTERTIAMDGAEGDVGTTRFPLMNIIFPIRGAVLTAGYGGYLDQSWAIEREGEQMIGDQPTEFSDFMQSEGGVGQFLVGAALPLGERLGVGASVGLHMGSQRVRYARRFVVEGPEQLDPYAEDMSWRYKGPVAQLGVRWEPIDIVRVGASVTWAGTLVGEPVDGRATRRELDLPLQVAAGASGFLVPGLLAAVSGRWSGWSVTDPTAIGVPRGGVAASAPARDTWEMGGGLEWSAPRPAATRHFPIRAGFQYRQLPFPFAEEPPTEWFAGGGAGFRVGSDARYPQALVDLTVQRGTRTAPGAGDVSDLTESMWRIGLSVSLFGN